MCRPECASRHMDVPRRRRWRSIRQKPRFLPDARWAGQDARIQRYILGRLTPVLAKLFLERLHGRIGELPGGAVI